jgi:RHS repeat-associated protein
MSSFGNKVGLDLDAALALVGPGVIEVVAYDAQGKSYYLRDNDDGVMDGIYPGRSTGVKELRLLDAGGLPTADQTLANTAELVKLDGCRWKFEVIDPGSPTYRQARITHREDRNGNAIVINYVHAANATLSNPRSLWIKQSITDAYGQTATFHYSSNTLAGWGYYVVEKIDLPNGESVTYHYGENGDWGRLTRVELPDATTATFSFEYETPFNVIEIDDPAADSTHRRKTVYLSASTFNGQPQASNRLRKVVNGEGELVVAIWDEQITGPSDVYQYVYEGGNRIKRMRIKNWSIYSIENAKAPSFDGTNLTYGGWELIKEFDKYGYYMPQDEDDGLGRTKRYTADWDRRINTSVRSADSTTDLYVYHSQFNWLTSHTDRIGRITTHQLDSKGNRLSTTTAAGTPSEATRSWTFNNRGQVLTATDANGNTTNYDYSPTGQPTNIDNTAGGYLVRVTEPADTTGGTRAELTYTYDFANGGRLSQSTDALGRTVNYTYDSRDRVTLITYYDGSVEAFTYGTAASGNENLLVEYADRNGNIEHCDYDDQGRETSCIEAFGTPEAVETTTTYLTGTDKPLSVNRQGTTTSYTYDNHNRIIAAATQADGTTTLTRLTQYDSVQRRRSSTDPYGRTTYTTYDINDRPTRTVTETTPGSVTLPNAEDSATNTLANDIFLLNLTRSSAGNAKFLIIDRTYDAEGQLVSTTDPRGIVTSFEYDGQGRRTAVVEAVGTPVQARTETLYDDQGNVVEVRTPRYFAPGSGTGADPAGSGKARTTMTYTGRNLLASQTEAPGTPEEATTTYTYFLDKRADTTTDARGNAWSQLWGVCCARIMATIDPLADADADPATADTRAATITRHDFYGNLTHQGRVSNVDNVAFPNTPANPTIFTDLPDGETLQEVTTRYDARHRPIATTTWLVPLPGVDPDNVPIAGGGDTGDPAVTIGGVTQGLTTTYTYDDDLTDSTGLDSTYAAVIAAKLPAGFFAPGSDGYGMTVTNPEGETTARFMDSQGRTVLSIDPDGDASTVDYDTAAYVAGIFDIPQGGGVTSGGGGIVLRTIQTSALGNSQESQTDGAGRTLRTLDAESNATVHTYDGQSNRLSFRDPANVGEDCVYDARGREIECRDTQEIAESTVRTTSYDSNSNVTAQTDAKGVTSTASFDARDRQVSTTDRINATTAFTYDANSNLLSITDAEGGVTSYTYDPRNLQTLTIYPNDSAQTGGTDVYDPTSGAGGDRVAMAYDALHRPRKKIDQLLDETTFVYDLAGRLIEKDYLAATGSPNTSDSGKSDLYTYDLASRLLTAESQRYGNTVNFTYTPDGQLATENLTGTSSDPAGYTVTRGYDADDRLTSITYPDTPGTPNSGATVTRGYTPRNQLASVTLDPDGSGSAVAASAATFTYDPAMRETQRDLGNGLVRTTAYTRNDHLTTDLTVVDTNQAGSPALEGLGWSYTYDANKNLATATTGGVMANYSFTAEQDAADRLDKWFRPNGELHDWVLTLVGDWQQYTGQTLDNGNLLAFDEIRGHNAVHEITSITPQSTGIAIPILHDPKGNLTTDEAAQTYSYDFDNQLTRVEDPNGNPLATIKYDALGRRVSKQRYTPGTATPGTRITYMWLTDPSSGLWQLLCEYEDNQLTRSYTHGSYVDEPLTMTIHASSSGQQGTYWYHRDRQYNVIALSDSARAILERYAYTPYGERRTLAPDGLTVRTTSQYANPHGHQGLWRDDESGLVYNRARYRDAGQGRWLGRDPLGYIDSFSMYMYLQSRPLSKLDPTGYVAEADAMGDEKGRSLKHEGTDCCLESWRYWESEGYDSAGDCAWDIAKTYTLYGTLPASGLFSAIARRFPHWSVATGSYTIAVRAVAEPICKKKVCKSLGSWKCYNKYASTMSNLFGDGCADSCASWKCE